MSIKILHLGDVHFCRETKTLALKSLNYAIEKAKEEKIDLWALAGDLFDKGLQNSNRDSFNDLIEVITKMLDIAPITAIYGTPSHDVPGCYEVLQKIQAKYSFTILYPGKHNILKDYVGKEKLLLFGLPEPSKSWLISQTEKIDTHEVNENIHQALKNILLGYGAIRKQISHLPCVMLYHGLINGASVETGQTLTSDIGLTKDDLSLVNANYYALGHIHKRQQLPGLPAYYSGSAFPVDWGELEQKGFNLITFEKDIFNKFFAFPHPPRKKIVTDWDDADEPISENSQSAFAEISGFQVWQEYRATKEQAKEIDKDDILKKMLAYGALPGSKVTISIKPIETVRAIDIQGKKPLREKIIIWAKNSSIETVRDSILNKADSLEIEIRKLGFLVQERAWRLQKIKTRGLKGIKRGMGLDEYSIDFESYDSGLIALVAENGTGKTTIMSNCHFFPSMLTGTKKMQDFFCLKDSYREILIIDDITGEQYRCRILVDGVNPSGKAEYYLEKKNLEDWQPIASGKKDYTEMVYKLFGSEEIYVRSAFIPSKPAPNYPDLSQIPQGKKKEIFYELAGIGQYKKYVNIAKEKMKVLDFKIEVNQMKIKKLPEIKDKIESLKADQSKFENAIKINTEKLETIQSAGETLKTEVNNLSVIKEKNARIDAEIQVLRKEKSKQTTEIFSLSNTMDTAKLYLSKTGVEFVDKAKNNLAIIKDCKENKEVAQTQLAEQNKKKSETLEQYNKNMQIYQKEKDSITEKIQLTENIISKKSYDKKILLSDIDKLQKNINQKIDICPTCGQILPEKALNKINETKRNNEEVIKAEQKRISICDTKIQELQAIINQLKLDLSNIIIPVKSDFSEYKIEEIEKTINVLNGKLKNIDIATQEKIIKAAETAETELKQAEEQYKIVSGKIKSFEIEIKELLQDMDITIDDKYNKALDEYEQKRKEYTETKALIAEITGTLKTIIIMLNEKQEELKDLQELEKKTKIQKSELKDWRFLNQACGIDGIPALELDAVAPEISNIANELLSEAYGKRFQIEFKTTRMAGTGSKKKQIEDFTIWIIDNEDEWSQPYETLSGGEETWIKKAIADAFEIIKSRNTGIKMLTVFQDELDGKLDPVNRRRFFKLLEKTHAETERYHTILVTHSPDIQDMIEQKIEMKKE